MSKSFTINNVSLKFVNFAEPRFDEMRKEDMYSCVLQIPNTDENFNLLQAELDDAIEYARTHKAAEVAESEPYIPDLGAYVSKDYQTIDLNINSKRPPVGYDAYGDVIEKPTMKRIKDAEVQLFCYVWVKPKLKTKWGVMFTMDALCVHDDPDSINDREDDKLPKLTFKKKKTSK